MAVGRNDPRQFRSIFKSAIPFTGTVTLTAAAAAETSDTVAVAGAEQGDVVLFGIVEDTESAVVTADVNVDGLVEFTLVNATGSTITIAAGTVVKGVVLKFDDELGLAGE